MCVTWNRKKMVICSSIFQEIAKNSRKLEKIRKSFQISAEVSRPLDAWQTTPFRGTAGGFSDLTGGPEAGLRYTLEQGGMPWAAAQGLSNRGSLCSFQVVKIMFANNRNPIVSQGARNNQHGALIKPPAAFIVPAVIYRIAFHPVP